MDLVRTLDSPQNEGKQVTRKFGEYCLVCFATLESGADACPACEHPVRPFERRKYWSLHSAHLRAQKWLIRLSLVLTIGLIVYFSLHVRGMGRGLGYVLAMPWFGFVLMLVMARHLTQHMAQTRAIVFLGVLPVLAVFMFLEGEAVWGTASAAASVIPVLIRMKFRAWKGAWIAGDLAPASVGTEPDQV